MSLRQLFQNTYGFELVANISSISGELQSQEMVKATISTSCEMSHWQYVFQAEPSKLMNRYGTTGSRARQNASL